MPVVSGYTFVVDMQDRGVAPTLRQIKADAKAMKAVMRSTFETVKQGEGEFSAFNYRIEQSQRLIDTYRLEQEKLRDSLKTIGEERDKEREKLKKLQETENSESNDLKKQKQVYDQTEERYAKTARNIENLNHQINKLTQSINDDRMKMETYRNGLEGIRSTTASMSGAISNYNRLLEEQGIKASTTKAKISLLTNQEALLSRQMKLETNITRQYQSSLASLQSKYSSQANEIRRVTNLRQKALNTSGKESAEYSKLSKQLDTLRDSQGHLAEIIRRSTSELQSQTNRATQTATALSKIKRETATIGTGRLSAVGRAIGNVDRRTVEATSHIRAYGSSLRSGFYSMAIGAGVFGTAIGKSVQMSARLQQSWVNTRNLLQTGAKNAREAASETSKVSAMQRDATKYSKEYGVSQKDIADQYTELVKRGYSAGQSLGSMKSMLEASRASGDDYSDVVKNVSSTLDAFNLRQGKTSAQVVRNSKEVTNAMAFAADQTATDFKGMGEAMSYVSASAHQAGFSVEQTTAAVGELSNAGIEGSLAGTSLRKVINSLISPTKGASAALQKYGMSINDFKTKKGTLKPLSDIMKTINKHVGKLGKADRGAFFKAVFGTTGQNAAMILSQNAKEMGDLVKKEERAEKNNYVNQLAKKNMQSTQMQAKVLKTNIEAIAIDIGNVLLPSMNKVINAFSKWAESSNGKSALGEFRKGVQAAGKVVANNAGNIMNFLGGFSTGLMDVAKVSVGAVKFITWPFREVAKYTGHSSDISRYLGIVAGGLVGIVATLKIIHTTIAGIRAVGADIRTIRNIRGQNTELENTNRLYERMIQLQERSLQISEAQAEQQGVNVESVEKGTATEEAENVAGGLTGNKKIRGTEKVGVTPYLDEKGTAKVSRWFSNVLPSFGATGGAKAGEKASTGFLGKLKALPGKIKGIGILGKIFDGVALFFAGKDLLSDLTKGITSPTAKGRYQNAGKSIGMTIGGGIGGYFGGAQGAAIGSEIANATVGWAYKAVDSFKKGWNNYTKDYKPHGLIATVGWDFKDATRKYNNWIAGIERKHPVIAGYFRWERGTFTTAFATVKFFIRNIHAGFKEMWDSVADLGTFHFSRWKRDIHNDSHGMINGVKNDWKGFFDWFDRNRKKEAIHKPSKSDDDSSRKDSGSKVKSLGSTRYSSADVKNLKSMTAQIGSYEKALKGLKSTIKTNDPTSELRHMNRELKGASTNWGKVAAPIKKIGDAFKYLSRFTNSMAKKDAFAAFNRDLPKLDSTVKKYGKSLTTNINKLGTALNKNGLQKPLKKLDGQIKSSTKTWKGFVAPVRKLASSFNTLQKATKTLTGKRGLEASKKGFTDLDNALKKQKIGSNLKTLSSQIKKSNISKELSSMNRSVRSSAKYWRALAKPLSTAAKSFHQVQSAIKTLAGRKTGLSSVNNDIKTLTRTIRRNPFGRLIAKQAQIANDAMSGKHSGFVNQFNNATRSMDRSLRNFRNTFNRDWKSTWSGLDRPISRNLDSAEHAESRALDSMESDRSKFSSSFLKGWNSWIDDVVSNFKKGFDKLPNYAQSSMKDIISRMNKGISGVNSVISDFGGDKKLSTISYANGTVGSHPGGHMLVNDSVRQHWKELVLFPNGQAMIPQHRNTLIPNAPRGTQVFSGEATHEIMASAGIRKYADGTDDSQAIIEKMEKNPLQALKGIFFKATSFTGSPVVTDFGTALADGFLNAIKDKMKQMAKDADDANSPAGTMSKEAFRKAAEQAAEIMHQSLSDNDIARLYHQAFTESNVNPAQGGGIDDHDGTGRPVGLFQFKLGTWGAAMRHVPGNHHNIHSAVDQIAAVLADSSWRSDIEGLGEKRGWSPHGYANGDFVGVHGLYEMAENNLPESIIPMDINKRPRALSLIDHTLDKMEQDGGGTGGLHSRNSQAQANSETNGYLKQAVTILAQIAGLSQKQIDAILSNGNNNNDIQSRRNRAKFYQQYGNDQRVSDYMSY